MQLLKILVMLATISFSTCTVIVTKSENVLLNGFNIVNFVTKFGYPMEVHKNIQTEDGYLLDIHRVPHGRYKSLPKKYPVLIMHGLVSSAEGFIVSGPERALGFWLADKGYDVWLGNARGNSHCKKHIKLNPKLDATFWDYSWHEIGIYDLPSIINYILEKTQKSRINYIGHSQGSTAFFVMASEKPKMNNVINLMIALAPVAFLGFENVTMPQAQRSLFNQEIESFRKLLGIKEVGPQLHQLLCNPRYTTPELCKILLMMTVSIFCTGVNLFQLDFKDVSMLLKIFPDSASAKQILHYMQNILSGGFSQYDYGPDLNIKRYKSLLPTRYNFQNITSPVGLFYGFMDALASVTNVKRLADKLPNLVENYLVPDITFNHIDFLIAKDVVKLLYNKVFETMVKHE